MYKGYATCAKEEQIDKIENNIVELKTNYANIKVGFEEVKQNQRLIIKLIVSGLVGLSIEFIGLIIGFLLKN